MSFLSLSNTTMLGRIARLPLKLLPPELIVPIPVGELRGKKWIVGSQRHACWIGTYERLFQTIVARHVKVGSVFHDVGANVGFYSLLASALVKDGTVYAFEPVPKNIYYLKRHLQLNRIGNVKVFEVAISDQVGTEQFLEEQTRAMGHLSDQGNYRVRTSTIDALIESGRVAPPDYIKMDIEGAEFKALLGARKCFQRCRPTLFLATHGQEVHEACCRLLVEYHYDFFPIGIPAENRAELFARPH
jgi:FkbM family methyltransferase